MKQIKFSFEYFKLGKLQHRDWVMLMQVFTCDKKDLSKNFIEYDTHEKNGDYYPLPEGKLLVLLFFGIEKITPKIFTTIRRWTPEKEKYYHTSMGETFEIIIEEKKQAGVPNEKQ